MAETIAVYLLFAVNAINGPAKRELIGKVLDWSGDTLSEGDVHRAMGTGLGNPGQYFNNGRPFVLQYLVAFARRIKHAPQDEVAALLADPWQMKAWMLQEEQGATMMREILLQLLFPQEFERIAAGDHKQRIRGTFGGLVQMDDVRSIDGSAALLDGEETVADCDVDLALLAIRRRIGELLPDGQESIPGAIDFYEPPLREAWDPSRAGDDPRALPTNLEALKQKRQVVFHGPPGTGKTFEAKALARQLIFNQALELWGPVDFLTRRAEIETMAGTDSDGHVRRLQLHQAYSYEDFVRGLRITADGAVEPADGYLLRLIDEIERANEVSADDLAALPWVVILDEINRTDLSRLLGECFSLLEDRTEAVELPMLAKDEAARPVRLPADLYVVGTMNLIDQSVEQLDFALRRRFLWLPSDFEAGVIAEVVRARWQRSPYAAHHPWERLADEVDRLAERATALNEAISDPRLLGPQYRVGHTYYFDVAGFLESWDRVKPAGQRPATYLWDATGRPRPPLVALWRFSLKPLLDEYLSGVDEETRANEVARLERVLLRGEQSSG